MSFVSFEPLITQTVQKYKCLPESKGEFIKLRGYEIIKGKIVKTDKIVWCKKDWENYSKLISYLSQNNRLNEKIQWIKAAWDQVKGKNLNEYSSFL